MAVQGQGQDELVRRERQRASIYGLLSLFMAFVVAGGVYIVISGYERALSSQGRGTALSTDVVVAATDLESGVVLEESHLKMGPVGVNAPADQIFTDVTELLGQTVGQPILAGEPLRAERLLVGGAELQFHEVIDPGSRALTISVDREAAVGGLLRPGHFVDVNLIAKSKSDWVLETLLQSVRVIAVDDKVASTRAAVEISDQVVDSGGGTALVTLEVDPPEARALALASVTGKFYLTLRPVEDFDVYPFEGALAAAELIERPKGVRVAQDERLSRKRSVFRASGTAVIRGKTTTIEYLNGRSGR